MVGLPGPGWELDAEVEGWKEDDMREIRCFERSRVRGGGRGEFVGVFAD